MKVIISGYGRMGHMVEKELQRRGIEIALASEDITAVDPALAKDCVCKAAVVGTTGWSDILPEVRKAFEDAGTPLIYASNFSLGVNALYAAVTRAAGMLKGAGYTPAIEETHHIHKLDAPSGTAKVLGALVEESLGEKPEITAHREGEVPGIHTVTFTSECDKLTFTHEAFSREGLAAGAVTAALMTEGLSGVHEFSELL